MDRAYRRYALRGNALDALSLAGEGAKSPRSLRGSGQTEREKTLRSAVLRRDQGNRASRRQRDGRKPRAECRSHFGAPGIWGSGDTPVTQDDTRRNSGGRQWRQTEGGPERGSGDD